MTAACQRQLPALALIPAVLLTAATLHGFAGEPKRSPLEDDLRAARMLEQTVAVDGTTAEESKKLKKVLDDLERKYPKSAAVKNALAEFLWTSDQHAEAVTKWTAAERLEPKNPVVLDHLGGAWLGRGEVRKAAEYFRRAAEADPASPVHHFNAGNVMFVFRHELGIPETEAFAKATEHFAEASRLAPQNADYAQAYAEIFYADPKPDWKAALQAWECVRQNSANGDFALSNLARVHLKLGEKEEARACLARIQSPKFDRLKKRLLERIETE